MTDWTVSVEWLAINQLNSCSQSVCCKHHSTETVLLYIHDHLINAIVLNIISLLPCKMWSSRPFILPLVVFPKTLFSALYSSPSTLPSQYSDLFPLPWPPLLCRWHSPFFFVHPLNFDSSISHLQNALQQISSWTLLTFLLLTPLRLNFAHPNQKPTCQNTQLFTWHFPLCSTSWLNLWRASYFLWL